MGEVNRWICQGFEGWHGSRILRWVEEGFGGEIRMSILYGEMKGGKRSKHAPAS